MEHEYKGDVASKINQEIEGMTFANASVSDRIWGRRSVLDMKVSRRDTVAEEEKGRTSNKKMIRRTEAARA